MSKISLKNLVKEDLEKPVEKLSAGWQPIVQKVEQVKIVENIVSKPRAGMKSLMEVQTELQPFKKEPVNELVQSFATQIEEQEKNRTSKPTESVIETITEAKIEPVSEPIEEETLIDKASAYIASQPKNEETFQQPVAITPANFSEVARKVKFLEEWIGKVSMAGPGSGETRFLRLDDVNYNSWQNRDGNKILKFKPSPDNNPAYDEVTFGFLTGDQGPVDSIKFQETGYTSNANVAAGLIAWNPTEDCLDIHQSNGTVLQTGLEHGVRVHNTNVSTIYQGNVVYYTGANGDGNPTGHRFIANSTCDPRMIIGLATEDIIVGATGRVTKYGKVRTLNTTGTPFGETWYEGNTVYAHPVIPGGLTIVEPAAPNVAITIGIVTHKDATDGIILVDVEKKERSNYGNFANTMSVAFAAPNTPYPVCFDRTIISSGIYVPSSNTSHLVANAAGLYNFQFSSQYTTSTGTKQEIYIWIRKNGNDVPDSGTQLTVNSNGANIVAAWNFIETLNVGEYIELVHATTSTAVSLLGGSQVAFMPNIPSVLMSVTQVS